MPGGDAGDDRLDAIARAILDGALVDWAAVGSAHPGDPTVAELRVLAALVDVHRRAQTATMPRRHWGHFELFDLLGQGATGVVYRARDPRLDRDLALKVIPLSTGDDAAHAAAILDEGRWLARVRHPNVVTIHGANRIGDEIGLWMEFVPGQTLESRLGERGPLAVDEGIAVARQVCDAVAAVHRAGLLHRDIKSTNVILADDGRAVLMDFGAGRAIANRAGTDMTGTPLYLAPEIFRGEPASIQSDIYSLGVLLFRLFSGEYPVAGRTLDDVRAAHARGERRSLTALPGDLPASMARAIDRALDPDPVRRFTGVEVMSAAFQPVAKPWSRRLVGLAAALALVVAAAVGIARSGAWPAQTGAAVAAAAPVRIAVRPFTVAPDEPDAEVYSVGLPHEIQRHLTRLDGIVPVAFTSSALFPTGKLATRDAAARLGADLVFEGAVARAGGDVRVEARAWREPGDALVWQGTFVRREHEIAALLDDIADAIVTQFRLTLRIARRHETQADVMLIVVRARSFQARRHQTDALAAAELFQAAVDRDPSYAPAWAGLAGALVEAHRLRITDQPMPPDPRIADAARRALAIDPMLAEAQAALGSVRAEQRDWSAAEAAFRLAIQLNPSLTSTHANYALSVLMPLNRNDDAIALLTEALTRDPESLDVRRVLAHFQVNAEQYDAAIATSRWVLERDQTYPWASLWLGRALALSGRPAEAVPIFAAEPNYWAYLGFAYARLGRRTEAEDLARAHPDDPRGQMMIYSGLGDKEGAIAALQRLAAANPWRAATWLHRPEMAVIAHDPRVEAVKAQLGIAGEPTTGRRRRPREGG